MILRLDYGSVVFLSLFFILLRTLVSTRMLVSFICSTTCRTSGGWTVYPSEAPEFTPVFKWVWIFRFFLSTNVGLFGHFLWAIVFSVLLLLLDNISSNCYLCFVFKCRHFFDTESFGFVMYNFKNSFLCRVL